MLNLKLTTLRPQHYSSISYRLAHSMNSKLDSASKRTPETTFVLFFALTESLLVGYSDRR